LGGETFNPRKQKMINKTVKLFALVISTLALAGGLRAAPLTAADVGDVDTFGRAAQFMGVGSGFVQLATTCSATPTPTPPFNPNDSQCFALAAAPATTTFDAEDICRIKLPKKSTKNIIYPVINLFLNYQLQNSSGVTQSSALFTFSAFLSIESDVLNNPSIIDPGTGLPAAGKFTFQFPYTFRDDRSMQDGDRQRVRETLVRVGNAGLNRAFFYRFRSDRQPGGRFVQERDHGANEHPRQREICYRREHYRQHASLRRLNETSSQNHSAAPEKFGAADFFVHSAC